MGTCLTDGDLTAFATGTASAEQLGTWNAHIAQCDSCAVRVARREHAAAGNEKAAAESAAAQSGSPDPDATITIGTETDFTQQGLPLVMLCERRDA